jgi:predicted nucleic acid-binding protein
MGFTMNTYLLDTNILIYAYNQDSELYEQAFSILNTALNKDTRAFIADKSLYEFFAIITDPKRVEKPVEVAEAIDVINFLRESNIKIIVTTHKTLEILTNLLKKYNLKKQKIFDAVLAALAIENKIEAILTRNDKDFNMINEITAINPFTQK